MNQTCDSPPKLMDVLCANDVKIGDSPQETSKNMTVEVLIRDKTKHVSRANTTEQAVTNAI
jgi:hypothetical protein